MSIEEQLHWERLIKILWSAEYDYIHRFYSIELGWCRLSYYDKKEEFTYRITAERLNEILKDFKKLKNEKNYNTFHQRGN